MREYYDKTAQLAEIMMFVTVTKHPYILVEGNDDILFYTECIPEIPSGMIRQLNGWENVVDMINLSNSKGLKGVIGIIDADYHAILCDGVNDIPNLLVTDETDIEMMLINSSAFDKVLKVYGSDEKLRGKDPRRIVKECAAQIGLLRFISQRESLNYCFADMRYSAYIDKCDLSLDLNNMFKTIYDRSVSKGIHPNKNARELSILFEELVGCYSNDQLCKGHDALNVMALGLTKLFGSIRQSEINEDVTFKCLLLAYTADDFTKTNLYKSFIDLRLAAS